jgi:hypothetical protein
MLAFEVVDFSDPYLKLKILGPTRVITVEARAQQALDCEQSSIELAAAMVATVELSL